MADNAALAAAEAYVMVAQAEEYATLLHKSRDTVAAHVKLAGDYVAQGMLVKSELLRAEVELARMDDLVTEADGRVRIANANLAFRLGAAGGSSWALAPCPTRAPSRRPSTAGSRRPPNAPTSARPGSSSRPGELEEKVKKAPLWPKVALVAKGELYGDKPFGSTGTSGSIMAVATWNVFQGGGGPRRRYRGARGRPRGPRGRRPVRRRRPARGPPGLRGSADGPGPARDGEEGARGRPARPSESRNDRFRAGVVRTLDLLDVTTARREAETRELVARADAHTAALRLAVKAGRRPETALNGETK